MLYYMHVPKKGANMQEWKGGDVKLAVTTFTKEDDKDQLWQRKRKLVPEDQRCQQKNY